ncbi:hypothetical protein QBC34DRAFT_413639 [Podospora aff. communis PSN243]|uniref:Uncharacterized protein n=1 Tax=Podospora aff. communis PSN243 TaxID=3040156 RepID=A0AAV9GBD2_9PEZI|nr:hypothetical protein QBC34DRAFT_413639 [Podospora aff. communis PSN243]
MIATKIFLAVFTVLTSVFTANAAIIDMFRDKNCKEYVGTRNVWDNTCAPTGEMGFESIRITAKGGFNQIITAYAADNCAPTTDDLCTPADNVGKCVRMCDSTACHALSSYFAVGQCF